MKNLALQAAFSFAKPRSNIQPSSQASVETTETKWQNAKSLLGDWGRV
jgi:hypothetical protein